MMARPGCLVITGLVMVGSVMSGSGPLAGPLHAQRTALDRYVATGLEQSLTLLDHELAIEQAEARWAAARRAYLPSLQFDARYSRAAGGRSFEIPTGDLMNPVYGALNDILQEQGQPGSFPTINNQQIDFLRGREQETRLRLTQVVFNPEIRANVSSERHGAAARRAGLDAARGQLIRDIKVAYYTLARATRAVGILDAAVDLVAENERSTTALWQTSLITRDQVHRTRAERLEVEQQREQARVDRTLAASYLNYLLHRPADTPIEVDPLDLEIPAGLEATWLRSATDDRNAREASFVSSLVAVAIESRAELREFESATKAADAGADAVRGSTLPSLAISVDAGIQGEGYSLGSDDRFAMASLVLSWRVTNGGAESARVRGARLAAQRIRSQRENATNRIRLEVETAARRALLAIDGLTSARERVQEAESAFRLVDRRRGEGLATGLEFLDARAALTRAQLSEGITEGEVLIRLAELDYAAGSPAFPVLASRTMEDNR